MAIRILFIVAQQKSRLIQKKRRTTYLLIIYSLFKLSWLLSGTTVRILMTPQPSEVGSPRERNE